MDIFDSIRIALRALGINKLRSALTMLGIVIGVAAVIAMVAIGAGAHAQVVAQIRSLGANLLIVMPGSARSGGARLGAGSRHTLTEDDAAAIADELPLVTVAAPAVEGRAQVVFANHNWSTSVVGAVPAHFQARDWQVAAGSLFDARAVASAAKVAVLGATVAERLFDQTDPIGTTVRIGSTPFTVAGVLAPKGNSASGRDQDDIVFVPLSTAKLRLLGQAYAVDREAIGYINVEVAGAAAMAEAERQIAALLRQRHRIAAGSEDDFTVRNMTTVFEAQAEASRSVGLLLAVVASVSLLVGGIGIMSMMLVSVTERTREIGLRLAVGARGRDIRNQFLIEAVVVCLVGGLAGLLLGALVAVGFARFGGWPVLIGPAAVAIALGFAATVGVFFGLYPALRASRLAPIEALRFE